MSAVLQNPSPDIDRFIDVIYGKVAPERPPQFEYIVDHGLMRSILTGMLGREWVEPDWDDRETLEKFLDGYIAFWRHMGYDYVRMERGAGFELTVNWAPDPGTEGQTERAWADLRKGPISSWEDFETFPWPEGDSSEFWMLEYINDHLPEGMGLLSCHGGGPFEIVGRLLSYEGLCLGLYDQPELVDAVVERVGRCMERFYESMLQLDNLRMIIQGDDMGHRGGLLISRTALESKFLPWHKRYAEMTHARGIPYCIHSCGQVEEIMPALIEDVGIDGKHSFEDVIVPVTDFYDRYADRIAVIGGIDLNILSAGTTDEVRRATRRVIEHCAPRGHYIVGSGNSIPSYVPLENYLAMVEEARR